MKNLFRISGLALPFLLFSSPAVYSQEQESTLILEEVIVTAQKREQSLQDVPIAVSALSADDITNAEIRDIRSLQLLSPSINVTQSAAAYQTSISIRGIGTSGFNPGLEPSVGVFVDGVYRSRTGSAIGDFNELERVEILRGPQSTLYGKNSSAGVIGYYTRKPEYEFNGQAELSLGNYSRKIASARVTGPLIDDTLAFSLAANYNERDGFIKNPAQGITVNDRDRWGVRGQLLWDASDSVQLRFIADKSKQNELCCAATLFVNGPTAPVIAALGGTVISPPDPFNRVVYFDGQMNSNMDDSGASLQIDWAVNDGINFTSITGYRDFESDTDFDADFTDVQLVRAQGNLTQVKAFTQELRFASTGDNRVDWQAGAFFYNQDLRVEGKVHYGNFIRPYFDILTGGAITQIETLLQFPPGIFFAPGTGMVSEIFDSNSDSWAVFGQTDIHLNDAWTLTVGLRYTDEKKTGKGQFFVIDPWAALPLGAFLPPPLAQALAATQIFPPATDYDKKRNEAEWSGNLILSWNVNDDLNTYASYSRGYKAGGFNLDRSAGFANPSYTFDPEFIDNYELGLKSRFWEGRSQLNIAVFYQQVQDFQTTLFDGIKFNLANAGDMDIYGVEVESQTQLTENLHWSLAVTYLDATYASYTDAPCPIFIQAPSCDLTGARKDDAPKWTGTTNLTWDKPISNNLAMFVRGEVYYRGKRFTAGDNDPNSYISGTTLLNASIGIHNIDQTWDIRIWGRNLADEEFPQIIFDTVVQAGSYSGYPNDPKTYGITARFWF
jgi:iron complex outermembrane recepter protein